jgi:hypothetical protein
MDFTPWDGTAHLVLSTIQQGEKREGIVILQNIVNVGMHPVDDDNAQKILWQPEIFDHLASTDAAGIVSNLHFEPVDAEDAEKFYFDFNVFRRNRGQSLSPWAG